ncbi:PREDICTED: uncharacterized protein LOC104774015 [Camelina sativa]|uniref:Uncharacterized protein LOC104774015 n=1 Tax=Camelina sativa TaxID=90675 RepID=A0ABM0Y813_CAMSA|nr:PREDICTED: uncharacterized protein LOC104774015 [Camelina sativa]
METVKPVVTPVVLKGANYLLWKRTTKTALSGRGLWIHVETDQLPKKANKGDGKEETEEDKEAELEKEAKWFQEDQTVLAILQNSLDAPILEAYSYCETAKELWDTLANVYGNITNLTRVFEVKKAINCLHQEDLEFTKHFGKFRSLWAELEMLRPSTIDPAILNERKEQDKVFGLLLTLNPAFNDLIKHILRGDKLPTLDDVCAQVQKEQGSLGLFSGKEELVMANKGIYKHEERKTAVCDHCKKKGHVKDKCWILHPHLKPAKFKANMSREGTSGQGAEAANQGGATAMIASYGDLVRKSDLEALIKSIAALKESGTTFFASKPSKMLVVDSGASHHMISNPSLLDNIEPALGDVVIANGDRVPVKGIGNLKLFKQNSKAFYMPTFTSNLLSVKKVTHDLNCYTVFGPNSVHFQDIKTGQILGEGDGTGDLYLLEKTSQSSSNPISFTSCLPSNNANALWHARLGHPHSRALELLLPNVSFSSSSWEQRSKLDAKSTKSIFIGYSTTQKGYKCYEPVHGRMYASRDVKFMEGQGYYETKDWNSLKDLSHSTTDRATNLRFLLDHLGVTKQSHSEVPHTAQTLDESTEPPVSHEHRSEDNVVELREPLPGGD